MRKIVPALIVVASLSHAFQIPFNISGIWSLMTLPLEPSPPDIPLETSHSPRIAIIGAGAGGSSAAFWIAQAKERHGLDVSIDIYERNDYIGGRSTTVHPYNNTAYEPVELGASIFVDINKNLRRATNEFNLSLHGFEDEEGDMGIWDGEQFLYTRKRVTEPIGSWLDNLKVLWRYGYHSPKIMQKLVQSMTDKYVKIYESDASTWTSIEDLSDVLGLTDMISQTGAEYFQSHGVSQKFANELIEAATRVNYAQNVDGLHALVAGCSLAASGGSSVKGGNWQIFEHFVKRSGARVFLRTEVVGIQRRSGHTWTIVTQEERRDYDAVILAAPYHSTHISLPDDLSPLILPQPYIHLHVTLLSTTAVTPNPEYFGYKPGSKVPTTVLTTFEGVRNEGEAPEFNSLSYLGQTRFTGDETEDSLKTGEWIVKIFSMEPISDEWLANVFQSQVGWVLRKEWDSYPVLPPTTTFPPVKLDDGLFYVNAFEPFISTMETETLASRNVVDWLLRDKFNSSICSDETGYIEKASDFIYGWDC